MLHGKRTLYGTGHGGSMYGGYATSGYGGYANSGYGGYGTGGYGESSSSGLVKVTPTTGDNKSNSSYSTGSIIDAGTNYFHTIQIVLYGIATVMFFTVIALLYIGTKRFLIGKIEKAKEKRILKEIQSRPLPCINNLNVCKRAQTPEPIYVENENEYVDNLNSLNTSLATEECLKEGSYYTLIKAKSLDTFSSNGFRTVVVKTLKENASEIEKFTFMSQYQVLKNLSHPNIIQFLYLATPELPVYFTVEFAELGSLRTYLRNINQNDGQPELYESIDKCQTKDELKSSTEILSLAWQVAKGMAYLADRKIVHHNLCTNKVFLTSHKVCKIGTFDVEQLQDEKINNLRMKKENVLVNAKWLALENLLGGNVSVKSNVWSFGVLLWELVSLGETPYPDVPEQNLLQLLQKGFRMEKPNGCSSELYDIIRSCWEEKPYKRPTFRVVSKKWRLC